MTTDSHHVLPVPPAPGAGEAAPPQTTACPGAGLIRSALDEGRHALDEREAKALLAAYELPTPMGRVVHTAEEAARVVKALGRPAVLKGLGPDIQHKSDRGLVALDVREADEARTAYHRIVDLGAGRVEGVLVEELVPHERELLVGMRRDEQFGPVVAFGLGGIFTEAVGDVAFALAPIDDEDAQELIGQLRAQRLLGAVRGLPRVDRARAGAHRASGGADGARPSGDQGDRREPAARLRHVAGGGRRAGRARGPRVRRARATGSCHRRAGAPHGRRSTSTRSSRLDSVAVIGASEDASKWGGSLMTNLIEGGYEGAIYPVNPRGGTIFGLPAYAALADLPATPELAIVALGGEHATPMIRECGRLGVPAALVIAAGFSEAGRRGSGAGGRAGRGRPRRRHHPHRPQLHGRPGHQLAPQRRRLRDPSPGRRSPQRDLAVGQYRHAAAHDRGATRHGRGEVRQQRQPGDHRRQRPARVPRRRREDRGRRDVPGGRRRRPPLLRRRPRDERPQARRRDARRHQRPRPPRRQLAHRRHGRLERDLRGGRQAGGRARRARTRRKPWTSPPASPTCRCRAAAAPPW